MFKKTPRVLFILKRREDYNTSIKNFTYGPVATGMFNSATFVSDMLNKEGIMSKAITVIDNNCIDREVAIHRPTHVFIEGFWVVPEKFDVLKKLHPRVRWFVRCHSEMPFLAQEGIAIGWAFDYLKRGIGVAGNSPRIAREIDSIARWTGAPEDVRDALTPMLPNYYPVSKLKLRPNEYKGLRDDTFDIGCFGAIRPMKNHLVQAIAAIDFAKAKGRKLRFHINAGRVEMYGANPLKNLVSLFSNLGPDFQLVQHSWTSHEGFLKLIASMDICMQVSFTETFNIVSADAVNVGVPIVVSKEVSWAHPLFADPTSSENIVEVMNEVWEDRREFVECNRDALRAFSDKSEHAWVKFFNKRHEHHDDDDLGWLGCWFKSLFD